MYSFGPPVKLDPNQLSSHFSFRNITRSPNTTAQTIINFLHGHSKDKNLLIENLKFLLKESSRNERVCSYCRQQEFAEYWRKLLSHVRMAPQPNFTDFELLFGSYLYHYGNAVNRAATEYRFFPALKELNDDNQSKLNSAINTKETDFIDCWSMYQQALLAKRHGTPGYVLIASICFWIANYHKRVTGIELIAIHFYTLAVQNLYCAYILRHRCAVASANARAAYLTGPLPIINEYSLFALLANIEAGQIEDMVAYIQKVAGVRLLGRQEICIAKQAALTEADQFIQQMQNHIVISDCAGNDCVDTSPDCCSVPGLFAASML